jgi:hypothetical protein
MLTDEFFDELIAPPSPSPSPAGPVPPADRAWPRWRIDLGSGAAVVVTVAPLMTAVEVRAAFPEAVAIEPIAITGHGSRCVPCVRLYDRAALRDWPTEALMAEADDLRCVAADARAEGLAALASAAQDEVAELDTEIRAREPVTASCSTCRRASRFGNCAWPVEAGISNRFELVRHPAAGQGCRAYEGADR